MIVLPYLTAIHFSGTDAAVFLHNQLSADVLALSSGESVFACYCEPKGRVLALMLVYRLDGDYYAILSAALAASVADRLKIYKLRSQLSIEVLEGACVSGIQIAEGPESVTSPDLAIPAPDGSRWFSLSTRTIPACTETSLTGRWKASELKSGISWLYPETSGQFLPQMLGFDQLGAVNFRKGCYPGQEIVARTHYLGKVKRHPRVFGTSALIHPDPLEKIQIIGAGNRFEAIVVDCGIDEVAGTHIFVVTRMDPEIRADQIEYRDELSSII